MNKVFPEPIRNLPEANIPLEGLTAYLSQSEKHQISAKTIHKILLVCEYNHSRPFLAFIRLSGV